MIEITALSKLYGSMESQFCALNNISMSVDQGEFLMIMGRSGCGKTTLLNIIGMIDTFDEGEYTFRKIPIKGQTANQLAKLRLNEIGYVYQSFNLIDDLNSVDNLELVQGYAGISASERRKRARQLLEEFELTDKEKSFPQQLSGGQQQRIAIARAVSNDPSLILADEPTGNLDHNTGLAVMEIFQSLHREGKTIIMVTHDRELLHYATRVLYMSDGILTGAVQAEQ